ncbi:MAG TPA: hypothetical protein VNO22_12320 [Planctomycetota bacterium]|nr:hypothetical protein [Planctomycetota bacterium]
MTANGDRRFEKILQGIQYLIRDNELLREDLKEYARQAAEDRKEFREFARQAAEDRKQAAEDRKRTNEIIEGIRKALAVIGKRGAEFIEIQKKQGEILDQHTHILRRHTDILERIEKKLPPPGGKNGGGLK